MNVYVPPLVTNADRDWALAQCPDWARRDKIDDGSGEIVDDGEWLDGEPKYEDLDLPNWDLFVIEQIERFEKFFAHDRKTYADWSSLWRKAWWPKANPQRRFPKMAPKTPHPFFRKGSPEFSRALAVATPSERFIWNRIGVAQFVPDDKRLERVIIKKEVIVKHETFPDVMHCKPPLTTVGDQALSEDTARTAAEKHWMANVRWRDGEKYMDFKNAKVDRIECSRSSVPVTNGVVGSVLPNEHRCEIIARPCRPGLEK